MNGNLAEITGTDVRLMNSIVNEKGQKSSSEYLNAFLLFLCIPNNSVFSRNK